MAKRAGEQLVVVRGRRAASGGRSRERSAPVGAKVALIASAAGWALAGVAGARALR